MPVVRVRVPSLQYSPVSVSVAVLLLVIPAALAGAGGAAGVDVVTGPAGSALPERASSGTAAAAHGDDWSSWIHVIEGLAQRAVDLEPVVAEAHGGLRGRQLDENATVAGGQVTVNVIQEKSQLEQTMDDNPWMMWLLVLALVAFVMFCLFTCGCFVVGVLYCICGPPRDSTTPAFVFELDKLRGLPPPPVAMQRAGYPAGYVGDAGNGVPGVRGKSLMGGARPHKGVEVHEVGLEIKESVDHHPAQRTRSASSGDSRLGSADAGPTNGSRVRFADDHVRDALPALPDARDAEASEPSTPAHRQRVVRREVPHSGDVEDREQAVVSGSAGLVARAVEDLEAGHGDGDAGDGAAAADTSVRKKRRHRRHRHREAGGTMSASMSNIEAGVGVEHEGGLDSPHAASMVLPARRVTSLTKLRPRNTTLLGVKQTEEPGVASPGGDGFF